LSDLEQRVWGRLDGDTAFYRQPDVDRLLNEGSRIVNLFAGFSQDRVALGLTVQSWIFYRIPSPIVLPMKVYLDGKELQKSTLDGAGQTFPKWLQGRALRNLSSWIPIGTRMFALAPPDSLGGRVLEVWGVTTPALLIGSNDTLTLDDDFTDLIVDYAYMNLAYREGGKPAADALKGYSGWMKRMRELQRFETKIAPKFWIEVEATAAV
jgi:hypothetical protein